MDVVLLVGRILFGLLFLSTGFAHLTQTAAMAGYAQSKGVPSPPLLVRLTGVQIIVGAVLVILGLWGDLGAILIFLFLLGAAFLMHTFWKETDPTAKQLAMTQFLKDLALAGAALAFWWAFDTGAGLTLTGPLL